LPPNNSPDSIDLKRETAIFPYILPKYGEHTLSNAELLTIMIRTGAPGKSSVGIGRQ